MIWVKPDKIKNNFTLPQQHSLILFGITSFFSKKYFPARL